MSEKSPMDGEASMVKHLLKTYEKMKKLQDTMKSVKKEYQLAAEKCLTHMKENDVDIFETSKYNLICKRSIRQKGFSKNFVANVITEFYNSTDKKEVDHTQALLEFLAKKRKEQACENNQLAIRVKKLAKMSVKSV